MNERVFWAVIYFFVGSGFLLVGGTLFVNGLWSLVDWWRAS